MKPITWCNECGTSKSECDCPTRLETALWWLRVGVWNLIRAWCSVERLALKIPGRPRAWALKKQDARRNKYERAFRQALYGFEIPPEYEALLKKAPNEN